jgi:hypothetical protein
MNAFVLTGDLKYVEAWRKQAEIVNANAKTVKGKKVFPANYGDKGWYNFTTKPYGPNALQRYYLSMDQADLKWTGSNAWLAYLDGKNPSYPENALKTDFSRIRTRMEGVRNDKTTPDTRLADDPMKYNPASVSSLISLMLGGIHPGHNGSILFSRLRYFDPETRRAGMPDDVAALIDHMTNDTVAVTLVNTSQTESRRVLVQAGGYAEHQFGAVKSGDRTYAANGQIVEVRLAPGTGSRILMQTKRYANQPTMRFPWDR